MKIMSEEILKSNASNEDNDNWNGIVWRFWFKKFLNRFNKNMDTGDNNYQSNKNSGKAFNFCTVVGEFVVSSKFFADDNEKTRNRVNEAMNSIRGNSDGASNNANDNIKYTE